jgi:hypothetical protein
MKPIQYCLLLLLFWSCHSKTTDVVREKIAFEIVTDSIYSRMPGRLIKTKDYLVWENPFTNDKFLHVHDIKSGREVGKMGTIGQGPGEFNTPSIDQTYLKNNILVYDLNTPHQALFNIDSLVEDRNPYTRLKNNEFTMATRIKNIGEDKFIIYQPAEEKRYRIISNENNIAFGEPFIRANIDNPYDIFQGSIAYNERRNKLIFTSSRLPYMEIYDIENNIPTLIYQREIPPKSYRIQGRQLKENRQRKGAVGVTALKDYIVTIQRDYDVDNTDESTVGMDFTKLPTTVFLYDYEGSLQRIVDVGIPIFRIAGDVECNTFFATGLDVEFVIIKCEL